MKRIQMKKNLMKKMKQKRTNKACSGIIGPSYMIHKILKFSCAI